MERVPDVNLIYFIQVRDDDSSSELKDTILAENYPDLTEDMVVYIIAELRFKATTPANAGQPAIVYSGDVVKSDIALHSALKEELCTVVRHLEEESWKEQKRRDILPCSADEHTLNTSLTLPCIH